jgi:hypothetical protein
METINLADGFWQELISGKNWNTQQGFVAARQTLPSAQWISSVPERCYSCGEKSSSFAVALVKLSSQ